MSQLVQIIGLPFLMCLIIGTILGYFGIHVLKREVIFIDIAVAQVAAVGTLAAHLLFDVEEDTLISYVFSLCCVLLISAFYACVRKKIVLISIETVIGISYAITAAGAMFLIGIAPGHAHAEEMLAGNLLWITWPHIIASAIVAIIVLAMVVLFRRPFHETCADYDHALAQGHNVVWWDFLFYLLLGAVITVSVRVAGVVVVFAFLILPATTAVLITRSARTQMFLAWIVLAIGSAVGLVFSYRFDFSIGPPVALFLAVILAAVAIVRRLLNLKEEQETARQMK